MKGKLFRVTMLVLIAVLVLAMPASAAGKPQPTVTVATWSAVPVAGQPYVPTASGISWTGSRPASVQLFVEINSLSGYSGPTLLDTELVGKRKTDLAGNLSSNITYDVTEDSNCNVWIEVYTANAGNGTIAETHTTYYGYCLTPRQP